MHMSHKKELTLGFLGDGQLARLCLLAVGDRYQKTVIYSLDAKNSPCLGLGEMIEARSWHDPEALSIFKDKVDVIILENEFVSAEFLHSAEASGCKVIPNASAYEAVSDKLKQVKLAESLDIPVPYSEFIQNPSDLSRVKFPSMLKSLRGGYDGYGNLLLKSAADLPKAETFIRERGAALAQEFIPFEHETAVLVIRDKKNCYSYPVVETVQEENICHYVITPPRLSSEIQNKIASYAQKLITAIHGVGLFGVEFFVKGNEVIFNEIAPRPHNSGHYSIEACNVSQFTSILNIIDGEALAPTLKSPCGMLNLLGTQNGKAEFTGDEAFTKVGHLHLYGKTQSRIGRKMGHFTLMGNNSEEILKSLSVLKTRYSL